MKRESTVKKGPPHMDMVRQMSARNCRIYVRHDLQSPIRHFKQHLFYAKSLLNTVGKARSSPDEMFDHVKGGALRSRGIVALMASNGRRPKRTLGEEKRGNGED